MSQQVVIPVNMLEKFGKLARLLEEAGKVAREISRGGPALSIPKLERPKHVPKDQEWFWTEEWQKGEREANEALERGDYFEFESVEEAIQHLHSHV